MVRGGGFGGFGGGGDGFGGGRGQGPSDGGRVVRMPQLPRGLANASAWVLLLVVIGIWFATGFYIVGPGEVGVVRIFGGVRSVTEQGVGLQYAPPYPIGKVDTPRVTDVKRVEIGFRTQTQRAGGPTAQVQAVPNEASMLTRDENVVNVDFSVQYRIKDPVQYLFRVRDPEQAVRDAAQAAVRQVVGNRPIDDILTTGKAEVQDETRGLMQIFLDRYQAGVAVQNVQLQDVEAPTLVQDAFKDVVSAREERARMINEAQSYQNDVIPKARGESEKVLREAEGYKAERVARAQGDGAKFTSILREYQHGKQVTRTRLYLETMEEVLPGVEVFIIDQQTGGIVPYLPLAAEGGIKR